MPNNWTEELEESQAEIRGKATCSPGKCLPIPLFKFTHNFYLQNDTLYFRVSHRQYMFSFIAIEQTIELKYILFLVICNSICVFMLLHFVELIALYSVKDILKPNIVRHKLNICNFISFLNGDDCGKVVVHTWKIVLCRTIKNIFTAAAIIVIYFIVCIEAELMSSDNYFKTLTERFRAIRTRSFEVLRWTWTVEVYTTS